MKKVGEPSEVWAFKDYRNKYHLVNKEVYDYIEALKAELTTTQKSVASLVDKIVFPPYDVRLEEAVKRKTQYFQEEINRLSWNYKQEKQMVDYFLERIKNNEPR